MDHASPDHSGQMLSDLPCDAPQIDDLFEQNSVERALIKTIERSIVALNDDGRKPKDPALIIALYGRFGQGKSRVLENITAHFQLHCAVGRKRRKWGFFRREDVRTAGRNIARKLRLTDSVRTFRVSNYQEKDLLENFDLFVEYRKALLLLVVFALTFILLFGTFGILSGLINKNDRLVFTLIGLLISVVVGGSFQLVSGLRLLWRDVLRGFRMKGWEGIQDAFMPLICGPPKLMIVDDLDRATIAQQKAILMSLRRQRPALKSVVLIAFDEEPLLSSMKDQASPNELLTKTFDVSIRLAPLNVQDAADMAVKFTRRLREINSDCPFAKNMNHPMIVGDLGRVFYLHGNASARFAKKLINNVYLESYRMRLLEYHDISALIRINGLFEYVPTMESDLDFVAHNLMDGTDDELIAVVENRFGESIKEDRKEALRFYLCHSRHMKPSHGGWQKILRVWREFDRGSSSTASFVFSDEWVEAWCQHDVFLVSRHDLATRRSSYRAIKSSPGLPPSDREVIRRDASIKSGTDAEKNLWCSLVNRLMAYDSAYIDDLNWNEFALFVSMFQEEALDHSPPLTIRKEGEGWGTLAQLIAHHSAFRNVLLTDNLRHNFRNALRSNNIKFTREILPTTRQDDGSLISAVVVAWPDFYSDKTPTAFQNHFTALKELVRRYPTGIPIFPHAHENWIRRKADNEEFEAIVHALLLLIPVSFGDDVGTVWPHETVSVAHKIVASQTLSLLTTITRETLCARQPDPLFWLACIVVRNIPIAAPMLDAISDCVKLPTLGTDTWLNLDWLKMLTDAARTNGNLDTKLNDWYTAEAHHNNANTDRAGIMLSTL